jgi:4-amino-4-deoxy-L-arabinose transferase-like glycosyltransferase
MSKNARAVFIFASLLLARLAGMILIPLNDVTEARYGEMARKMLETGNWVTPLHDYGVPFLAKPPLWAWMSAASMGVFGVNEFAARLPALLLSAAAVALVAHTARRQGRGGLAPALVLAGSFGFFAASGTVMTDPALVFCTTLVLCSFWLGFRHGDARWRWIFFAGCGLGLLAKGPVACVIAGLPVFFWVLRRREWKNLWRGMPWVRGALLTLLIAAPWYIWAEIRTPGFLKYFLVGENFMRFIDKGWGGDRYGYAHAYPYGTVWLFALTCFFPWSFALPAALKNVKNVWRDDDGWMLFLALWSVTSLVFFTFCANIIWPYGLPALPGCALLLAEIRARRGKEVPAFPALFAAAFGVVAIGAVLLWPQKFDGSEKDVVALWRAANPSPDSALLFWGRGAEFSAAFYSQGRAKSTADPALALALLENRTQDCIVSPSPRLKPCRPRCARVSPRRDAIRTGAACG